MPKVGEKSVSGSGGIMVDGDGDDDDGEILLDGDAFTIDVGVPSMDMVGFFMDGGLGF